MADGLTRMLDGRWITVRRLRGALDVAVGDRATPRHVAHASNPYLHDGLVLARADGGYYLATAEGYVTLDEDGRRLDPLGPFEHLRAVRSGAATAAWWALAGLVPCLLLGFVASALLERIAAKRRGRARRGWRAWWASAVLGGAALHALSALVLLADFWKAIP